mmetsp:Transcript_54627/g.65860  ORF Transcript_54627/g.65860 Transcript_54627/m.65860 type:complete len:152 (-) Transcript_54627:552-1007(-)
MIVCALIEELLAFEENRASFADKKKKEEGNQLMAIISTLGVFREAFPDLLQQHIDTILPYLKGDNGVSKENESLIVSSICRIISRVVPLMAEVNIHRMSESGVCDDLERITYNFGSQALNVAIEALSSLSGHKDTKEGSPPKLKLTKLATT